nr:MAG TPA: hypothetical protein [Caudoviricetes sp.]
MLVVDAIIVLKRKNLPQNYNFLHNSVYFAQYFIVKLYEK